MGDFTLRTADRRDATLSEDAVNDLAARLRGPLLTPQSPGYDEARTIWNAMIDRRPGLIARCAGAADVMQAVRFARENGLLVSVRGGGHNIAGNSLCDGGLLIDLGALRFVHVDPISRTARVAPGATLSDLDRETQAFGLAVPVGINSTTGIAGLTLGGGFGWLTRKYGLTVDNLLGADVVTADGKFLRASADENDDLFWAIRGGGGNFGIVTSFTFRLHPVGPMVFAGLVVHPFAGAGDLMRRYRDATAALPDEATAWMVLRKAPPLPFLPPDVHGKEVVVMPVIYAGDDEAAARKALEPVLSLGTPVGEHVGLMPYAAWQAAFDPLLVPGARNYWKSQNFTGLEDGLIDLLVEEAGRLPSDQCEIFVGLLGAAANRVPADATAYPHRDALFVMNVHARWNTPPEDSACIQWARGVSDRTARYATGGVYVNFVTDDEQRVQAAYGPNYERLRALKAKYDPTNLFCVNQNIAPGG
ncbi:FAD-linked oxidase [Azospirillum argentinense]|uniref:FAD-binding oxidoreductase n=2 Tax=Azospirillum TaxID=191 RepID=A0A5B0KSK0_9PROT|nr:FAD-binding oxidoreductase [Azospirillum argentinense]AIB12181.1 FAD-linked oxidase [Azospirillum argentinense]EZQ09038.1 FAD-linked oxidase [Azospirillum argentinense]KAA1054620.1 Putative oxidoreductase [Azospirillum argentinense]PNQ96023.1 FAD-binding oxidoreductase [Azospirillum argentinense]QCO01027.1 FAD-binding oxidoreductase [Azospirillum argentinense]